MMDKDTLNKLYSLPETVREFVLCFVQAPSEYQLEYLEMIQALYSDTPQNSENTEHVMCPFCKVEDFDLIGLKYHFQAGYCKQYNETEE